MTDMDNNGGKAIFDGRIQGPFSMICCGPSQAGKTQWTLQLLDNLERLVNPVPRNICWFYGTYTKDIAKLKNIKVVQGLPKNTFEEYIEPHVPNLFIFDDLMMEASDNRLLTDLFCRRGHHDSVSLLYIVQDLFFPGKERKTFLRCAHYLVLFASPLDMSSIYAVAHKVMPHQSKSFFNIFEAATRKPHSYLFIDGRQSTPPEARFRTDIFNYYQRAFVVKQQ